MSDSGQQTEGGGVLFYDGDCGLCTRSVRFFMWADQSKHLSFAPLQGATAAKRLPKDLRVASSLSTVVYMRNGEPDAEPLLRSEAVGRALIDCGGFWAASGRILLALPRGIREAGYRFIARHRLKIFPQGACALPTQAERARLLP